MQLSRSLSKGVTWLWLGLAAALPVWSQDISTAAANSIWGSATGVWVDSAKNVYVADSYKSAVYKVDRLGQSTIVAGTQAAGFSGDGALATNAKLYTPTSVATDADGNIYIADCYNHRIRKVDPQGIINTFAGGKVAGYGGDGGPATSAKLYYPYDIAVDSNGNVFFSERGARIRMVDKNGIIKTVAGTGKLGSSGDGGPALLADIDPGGIQVMPDGSIYFTDDGALSVGGDGLRRVRKIGTDSMVSAVAGTGEAGYSGDGGQATAASLNHPLGVAVDAAGNVYIAEFTGARIRKVAPNGIITTYAGTGAAGATGDGGPATSATLNGPADLAVDSDGTIYIADYYNHRVRKVTQPAAPTIAATNAAIPSFLGKAGFTSNTYIEIYGSNLAQTQRTWRGSDFNGANAPTTLDGVSVTVNGKPAFVYFVSPSQININTPDDTATGTVNIQVKNAIGYSNTGTVQRTRLSPTMNTAGSFNIGGKQYVIAQTPDFKSFIGKPGMITGLKFVAAKPGDTVIIFALGCGPTNPATHAGVMAAQNSPLTLSHSARIGGSAAKITFAGVVAGTVGLYQFNIEVPHVSPGDLAIELTIDGVKDNQNLVITVGQ